MTEIHTAKRRMTCHRCGRAIVDPVFAPLCRGCHVKSREEKS